MATINYKQLVTDGFSLSEGDSILIHGITYEVRKSMATSKYFLENIAGYNGEVFRKFRLGDSKYSLARVYEKDVRDSGDFPEFNYLDNLTKFVIWLIKTSLFQVGDKVRISKCKTGEVYPFGFNDGMQKYSGDIATIAYIEGGLRNHSYNLKEFGYSWSENQLELVSEAEAETCDTGKYIECLEVGEHVMVGGKKCIVYSDECRDAYWISLGGEPERAIYDNLGITNKQKEVLAKKYNATNLVTASPEFGCLEDLTDFVNALNSGEWKNPINLDKKDEPKRDITYEDLIDGYILQEDDKFTIAGIPYIVNRSRFLATTNGYDFGKIFDILGIEDRDAFCEKFGKLACKNCCFPEFETYEGLTKCVIELMDRAEHIPVSPEPFAVSMDYGSGSSTSIVVSSELMSSSTLDTGIVRLPEIKDDFKIIL